MSNKINIAIVGVGNCASSLCMGLEYYKNINNPDEYIPGLMHPVYGGFQISDIVVKCAFDVDKRKVGKDLSEAIFSAPNNTKKFSDIPFQDVTIMKSPILDGVAPHMRDFFQVDESQKELSRDEILTVLKDKKADIIINYLPVGTKHGTEFWAQIALDSGCALVNCIPEFIASEDEWSNKFKNANIPIIGDDIKSQLGATIIHRTLADLFKKRGVKLDKTYQMNVAGNTDFLNMLDRSRLVSKKISKTEAVQSVLSERLDKDNIYIGPSDYIPFQKDNKIAFIRMEGKLFGDIPMNIDMRLSVEDSPNSAGIAIDAIRCAKLALERKIGGALIGPSAWLMKHPPKQFTDDVAYQLAEDFIADSGAKLRSRPPRPA